MATINMNYRKLSAGYLFPEIARRTREFQRKHPEASLKRLGIGNTTEPLPPSVIQGLHQGVDKLSSLDTYTGYGDEQGNRELRDAISSCYATRQVTVAPDDIFVSDGAKPDSSNIQSIFGNENRIAIQDPAYPVYVDSNVIAGRTGLYDVNTGRYDGFVYMPCNAENGFFPAVPEGKVDLIYLCSPNNPTGAVATHAQLADFVEYARREQAVIIFDASYSEYISDPSLPRSIYEIEGAETCSIEINSFSKFAGFTGVRLGWTVVPEQLMAEGTEAGEIRRLWFRRQCTFFNGASNIVQEGGLAVLSEQGLKESRALIDYYMGNAAVIRESLQSIGLTVYGGDNAPYLWVKTPDGLTSWQFFDKLLSEAWVISTPGSGFGPAGEGYLRLSAFGHREDIIGAVKQIQEHIRIRD